MKKIDMKKKEDTMVWELVGMCRSQQFGINSFDCFEKMGLADEQTVGRRAAN